MKYVNMICSFFLIEVYFNVVRKYYINVYFSCNEVFLFCDVYFIEI